MLPNNRNASEIGWPMSHNAEQQVDGNRYFAERTVSALEESAYALELTLNPQHYQEHRNRHREGQVGSVWAEFKMSTPVACTTFGRKSTGSGPQRSSPTPEEYGSPAA